MSHPLPTDSETLHAHAEQTASLLGIAARLERSDAPMESLPVDLAKPRDIADRAAMAGRMFLLRPAEDFEVAAFVPQMTATLALLWGRLGGGSALNVPGDVRDALPASGSSDCGGW